MPATGAFHVNVCGAVGVETTSGAANGFSDVVVAFLLDGARSGSAFPDGQGGEGIVLAANNGGIVNAIQTWSQCYTFPNGTLAAGTTHTFQMGAQGEGGSNSIVGATSDSDSALQGQLYVEVIVE
jgi:hypothetical protein